MIRFRRVDDPFLDIGREAVECLLHIDIALRRDLHKGYPKLVSELLSPLDRHRSLFLPVTLVSNQDFIHPFGCVLLDVGEPSPDV